MSDLSPPNSRQGRSREVRMDLDEVPGSHALLLHIKAPGWSFSFIVPTLEHLTETLGFFRSHQGTQFFSERVIGTFFERPVYLIKDDEFADRFWIRAWQEGQMLEFALSGDFLHMFMAELSSEAAEK